MKRYCKLTSNGFYNKKNFNDDKKFYFYDRFFVSNQNFTTKHVLDVQKSRFLFKILGFSKFPGKMATLVSIFQI